MFQLILLACQPFIHMINPARRPVAVTIIFLLFFGSAVFAQDSDKSVPIPQELVGKWCYLSPVNGGNGKVSNTCITLAGDGTYEFFLDDVSLAHGNSFFPDAAFQEFDSGTWSAQGNTITYSSSANGKGSFQFEKVNHENVPMIVVNGQAFATATHRDPW